MGKRGAADGLISKAQKAKMARRVQRALVKSAAILKCKGKRLKMPEGCLVSTYRRPYWLPAGWVHGVKVGTNGYSGRGLPVYVSPEGRRFYHKVDVEKYVGRELTVADGVPPSFEELLQNVMLKVPEVRADPASESALFACLDDGERSKLPDAKAFHFCVVSARRTTEPEAIKACLLVEAHFAVAGVKPRWYVDAPSLGHYKSLGFDAVPDGGGLVAARNKALADAAKLGKVCCQVSDDISHWKYYRTARERAASEEEGNRLARAAKKLAVSPVAAARFLVAKMRASPSKPKLGGVYPNDNMARGFCAPPWTSHSFILGDFFVCEKSPVRFDKKMTLKEDFDFSCSHIKRHGGVLRCNRLSLVVKHRVNTGGAVTVRSPSEEQKNIKLLMAKWPKAIRLHTRREDEVVLQWPR